LPRATGNSSSDSKQKLILPYTPASTETEQKKKIIKKSIGDPMKVNLSLLKYELMCPKDWIRTHS
jgi:hypothetical protein